MPDHDETSAPDQHVEVVDLTDVTPASSTELRSDVDLMVAEVEAATRRIAPLLRDATALLAQVDRMVCDYAAAGGPDRVDERYWAAVQSSGHEHLFDALQQLSVLADAYVVVDDHHPAVQEATV